MAIRGLGGQGPRARVRLSTPHHRVGTGRPLGRPCALATDVTLERRTRNGSDQDGRTRHASGAVDLRAEARHGSTSLRSIDMLSRGVLARVWNTTQYRSVNRHSVSICSSEAVDSRSNEVRIAVNPTGADRLTPSVPLKSRSPRPGSSPTRSGSPPTSRPRTVSRRRTLQGPAAACRRNRPAARRPVAGCRPASTRAIPVGTEQLTPSPKCPSADNVTSAESG